MNESEPSETSPPPSAGQPEPRLHRSGAVAKMLGMPVATLRVWERRYGLTRSDPSPGGQRCYSAADVRRLSLIKQLADRGHAIGSLAPLDLLQLRQVASTDVEVRAGAARNPGADAPPSTPWRPWRLVVIGAGLGKRLQRPALLRRLGRPLDLVGPFDDAAQAAAAVAAGDVDAVLVHTAQLHDDWLASFDAAAPVLARLPRAVLYGFAADATCDILADQGIALLREPQPDTVVAQWLQSLWRSAGVSRAAAAEPARAALPPRRWDDAALGQFAGMATTIACECPRHVSELLLLLSRFEDYSAECGHRNVADAELHAYLQRVAQTTRAQFESALERVALHEGFVLPPSTSPVATKATPGLGATGSPGSGGGHPG